MSLNLVTFTRVLNKFRLTIFRLRMIDIKLGQLMIREQRQVAL